MRRPILSTEFRYFVLFEVHLNMYIHQTKPVVSYLTALTGLTKATLDAYGIPLDQALATLRSNLPNDAILVRCMEHITSLKNVAHSSSLLDWHCPCDIMQVGQNIRQDIEWLGLREGVDFESLVDLVSTDRLTI
jgi:hypothetical protein